MRTIEVKLYGIDELTDTAKNNAHSNYLNSVDYAWSEENRDTLNKFVDIFPVELRGRDNDSIYMLCDDEIAELKGVRLLKYLVNNYWNDLFKPKFIYNTKKGISGDTKSRYSKCQFDNCCTLTGYCMDMEILDPVYKFLKTPDKNTTFEMLMQECLNAWEMACRKDEEYQCSLEYFIETAQANEWEFTENGEMQ